MKEWNSDSNNKRSEDNKSALKTDYRNPHFVLFYTEATDYCFDKDELCYVAIENLSDIIRQIFDSKRFHYEFVDIVFVNIHVV